jgi:DUF1680 family protein
MDDLLSWREDRQRLMLNRDRDPLSTQGIHAVKLAGEMGRRMDITARNNLRVLDLEGVFLQQFHNRKNPSEIESFERFTGVGMVLDAAVLLAHYSEDPEDIAIKDHLIQQLLATQGSDGYIGAFEPRDDGSHYWEEYNYHEGAYLVRGLLRDYQLFGRPDSLNAARKLADHLMEEWPRIPQDAIVTTLGTDEAFIRLHAATAHRPYLDFCTREPMGRPGRISTMPLYEWAEPLEMAKELEDLASQADESDDTKLEEIPNSICHMYRFLSRCAMQLQLHRMEPAENLLVMSRRVLEGMTRHARGGMVVTGTVSMAEGWHETQDGRGALGETCATVHLLHFLDELLRLEGDLRYGDIMERAIFNALFAAQSPDGRHLRYYTSFSGARSYFEHDTYCCPGNFRRGIGVLPSFVFYGLDNGVAVNLYGESTARIDLGDDRELEIQQETDYPTSGHVVISIDPSITASFSVRLRMPAWCSGARVTVNDEPVDDAVDDSSGTIEIDRRWERGDTITVDMPMPWRFVKGREMQEGRVAVMRGPVVYCLNPDRNPGLEGMRLRDIVLDPSCVSSPERDDAVRPQGTTCRLRGRSPGRSHDQPTDLALVLSEYPDPGGREIYFRTASTNIGVEDELISIGN